MLPACTAEQNEYVLIAHNGLGLYGLGYGGPTAAEVCRNFAVGNGGYVTNATEHICNVSFSSVSFPVSRQCEPYIEFTSEKIADMSAMWGLFLVVAIVIYGLKRLLGVFESSPHVEH